MNRALAFLWVCLTLACAKPASAAASAPAAQEHPLKIVYVRSGGFAGFLDQLTLSGDSLELTRRKKLTFERKLTAEEQKSLAQLEQAALAAPPPGTVGSPKPDRFHFTLTVGDASAPQLELYASNSPAQLSPAWNALVERLQLLLDAAVTGH